MRRKGRFQLIYILWDVVGHSSWRTESGGAVVAHVVPGMNQ